MSCCMRLQMSYFANPLGPCVTYLVDLSGFLQARVPPDQPLRVVQGAFDDEFTGALHVVFR